MFVLGAAVVTNLFGLRDLLLPDTDPIVVEWPTGEVEEFPQQLISLQGFVGSPEHSAAVAWQEFVSEYDLETAIANVGRGTVGVPREYLRYQVYSLEMLEKVREITARYNLSLLGELLEDTIPDELLFESDAFWTNWSYQFSCGTFNAMGWFDDEVHRFSFTIHAARKGIFNHAVLNLRDFAEQSEWLYENAHGEVLLLVQGAYRSLILQDSETAFITVDIEAGSQGVSWNPELPLFDRSELERFADSINFRQLQPDGAAMSASPIETPSPEALAVMAQMAGNWTWYFANPLNASHMNLSADGIWVSPGPLPTDHTMGGYFDIVGMEDGYYVLRFVMQHDTSPFGTVGDEIETYFYDAQNDRLGMILGSGEGYETVWFWRD
jgi:hypothetical protein